MRLKLIACEVLCREFCAAAAHSVNQVDVEFLPKGLHDLGAAAMRARLQDAVDSAEAAYDAVVLGYALCGNGLVGLAARSAPLVVARAHDCITLFLGSKERYLEYFHQHPGVYFKTSGWIERGKAAGDQLNLEHASLVARYGEENGGYLYRELTKHYRQFTFIEMGVEPDDRFERQTREAASAQGWAFEKVEGDMSLIRRLLDGPWDESDFLVVPPGSRIVARQDDRVMDAERA